MNQGDDYTTPLPQLFDLKQYVPSSFCCDECRGCCKFREAYWLPRVLAAEEAWVGRRRIELVEAGMSKECQFLDAGPHHCRIYAHRPFECRLYPFLLTRRRQTLDLVAHRGCPYVTRRIDTQEYAAYSRYLTELLCRPPLRDILGREKEKFHTYPAVELYLVRRDVIRQEHPAARS